MRPFIRPARNSDAQDLFGLISLCFAEYKGCFVDPHDDLADLRTPAICYANTGGGFWVIEDNQNRVCACCGVDFPEENIVELHRLYVRHDARRQGLAQALLTKAENYAKVSGAKQIILWSDTRFTTAHQFYLAAGFTHLSNIRVLKDISHSREYGFEKKW